MWKKTILGPHTNRTHETIAKRVDIRNKKQTINFLYQITLSNTKQFIKIVFAKQDMIFMECKLKHDFHLNWYNKKRF